MIIVHVTEAWQGGISSYVTSLIERQVEDGHTVHLFHSSEIDSKFFLNIRVFLYRYDSSRNPFNLFRISNLISCKLDLISPDLIHAHSSYPGFYVRSIGRWSSKIVFTPHAWSFFKSDINFILRWVFAKCELYLSGRCFKIICMSRDEVSAALSIGINPFKIELVYTGIKDLEVSKSRPLGNDVINVGFFGRFDHQKGVDILIGASGYINSNIKIHLVGAPVRGVGVSIPREFILHGWIPHSKIPEFMDCIDVVVVPSRWEGFALVPIEAMRASKPVVVSNKSSLTEVVINGFNGWIFPIHNSVSLAEVLNSLTSDSVLAAGFNARRVFLGSYTFDKFYNSIMSIYSRVK